MNPTQGRVQQQITEAVEQLRSIVHDCSTESVVGSCLAFNLRRGNDPEYDTRLMSPAKQCSFLLGILLESEEPEVPGYFDEEDWKKAESLLGEAFSAYLSLYFPSKQESESLSEEWYKVREVAMVSFLHYFNSGLLASTRQITERVRRYLTPFDEQLAQRQGISATQALEICEWFANRSQKGLDDLSTLFAKADSARHALLDEAEAKNWSAEDIQRKADTPEYRKTFEQLTNALDQMGKLQLADLKTAFPHTGERFWSLFSVGRGKGPVLNYPTERSVAEERPLIRLSDTEALCPSINTLFSAVLLMGEQVLTSSEKRESYFRARDRIVESEAAIHFRRLLGSQTEFHSSVFETPDRQYEHDLVILDKELCLIVEAKASPPVEPFRDPEKAFIRLRDAFRADTGVQKAYRQAMRLWRRLQNGESVVLYNDKGSIVAQLSPELTNQTFCVCVTRDNYGQLATDLALLLEKKNEEPYPWAINVLDLESLAEAWNHFDWGAEEFLEYLQYRIRLHGKVFSDDELVFVGYYIKHGSLKQILQTGADSAHLNPSYSDVFDDIYRYYHQAGPPVELKRSPPVLTDLRKSLMEGKPVSVNSAAKTNVSKVGRNEPCPCGSGKKYKKCHGR